MLKKFRVDWYSVFLLSWLLFIRNSLQWAIIDVPQAQSVMKKAYYLSPFPFWYNAINFSISSRHPLTCPFCSKYWVNCPNWPCTLIIVNYCMNKFNKCMLKQELSVKPEEFSEWVFIKRGWEHEAVLPNNISRAHTIFLIEYVSFYHFQ